VSASKPGSFLGLGTPVLPPLPLHSGDRNRTSPFAFTGNKFEFRALGSSQSPGWPNTVLNTIVAQSIDRLTEELAKELKAGATLEKAVLAIVKGSYGKHSRIVFNGDGYSEVWHAEAEKRGLANLRSTVDALPWLVEGSTVELFKKHKVLSKRELEARYEVCTEQYTTKVNIEAETAASIARTLVLPAALRHLALLKEAGVESLVAETQELVHGLVDAIGALEKANLEHPHVGGIEHATYMRDAVLPAMGAVREVADKLERIVADDLWPLPKYAEMLFIK
jgi:glutamine synthetase